MLKYIYYMFEMYFESFLGGEIFWENVISVILKVLLICGYLLCWKLIDFSIMDFLVFIFLIWLIKYLNVYILVVEFC